MCAAVGCRRIAAHIGVPIADAGRSRGLSGFGPLNVLSGARDWWDQ